MLSRQHYKIIGHIVKTSFNQPPQTTEEQEIHARLVKELCSYFAEDNPRFDSQKFIKYVNTRGD